MKLRCPKCQTVNTFEDGEALRCGSCGFDGKRIEGVPTPVPSTPLTPQRTAPVSEHARPTPAPVPAPVAEPPAPEPEPESPWEENESAWDESMWPDEAEPEGETRTDGFSVAALVLGILPLSLLAIIFGAVGISRCNKHEDLRGKGMAVAGLVLGIVWLAATIGALLYTLGYLDGYI